MKYTGLALAVGCAAGYYLVATPSQPLAIILLSATGVILLCIKRRRWGVLLLCAALGLGWYYGYTRLVRYPVWTEATGIKTVTLTATADSVYSETETTTVAVRYKNAPCLLFLKPDSDQLLAGYTFDVTVTVAGVWNPTYAAHLYAESWVNITSYETSIWALANGWRRMIGRQLIFFFPERTAHLLNALLLGDTYGLTESEMDALRESGLAHAVSVSGLHVSTMAGFVLLLTGRRKKRALFALPVIFLFVLTAGAPASAVRAGIMQASFLIGGVLGRDENPLGALEIALTGLLLWNPNAIADVGLQLSFVSSLGLILYGEPLQNWLREKKLPRFAASSLSASLTALLFSTPICAVVFGKVSIIAPLSNLLCLWAVNGLFLGGLFFLAVSGISLFIEPVLDMPFEWLGTPLTWLGDYFTKTADFLADIPYASVYTSQFLIVVWLALAYALFLLFLLNRKNEPIRPWVLGTILGGTLTAALLFTTLRTGLAPLEITILNVGQGQSVLVQSGGHAALIDCGSRNYNAARAASSALRSQGLTSLDYLLLTHGHDDHVSGVNELVWQVASQGGILGPVGTNEQSEEALPYVTPVVAKTELPLGNATLVLLPPPSLGDGNEQCMSVFIRQDDFTMGLTGDLSGKDEQRLLNLYELPVCDILVAGHHGSASSTSYEWLRTLQPQATMVSVGNNTYGHPSPAALGRMTLAGAKLYRTDYRGNITIRVNAG